MSFPLAESSDYRWNPGLPTLPKDVYSRQGYETTHPWRASLSVRPPAVIVATKPLTCLTLPRQYECTECPFATAQLVNCKRHMKNRHNIPKSIAQPRLVEPSVSPSADLVASATPSPRTSQVQVATRNARSAPNTTSQASAQPFMPSVLLPNPASLQAQLSVLPRPTLPGLGSRAPQPVSLDWHAGSSTSELGSHPSYSLSTASNSAPLALPDPVFSPLGTASLPTPVLLPPLDGLEYLSSGSSSFDDSWDLFGDMSQAPSSSSSLWGDELSIDDVIDRRNDSF
ncbi:hypothetical protein EXIGLDRAFT_758960 [Exidia glandulosa HHB12029]|uniref:C2H2-type domain-containing protein n=1 Tax=Exidia glandulosa HHB12029 TaxID=1314781 RepID=A0A165QHC1_EXIGL|nr:hypothetical protein EXIGLDRAFT_758960 [Exidia glandulosa HHB12029]